MLCFLSAERDSVKNAPISLLSLARIFLETDNTTLLFLRVRFKKMCRRRERVIVHCRHREREEREKKERVRETSGESKVRGREREREKRRIRASNEALTTREERKYRGEKERKKRQRPRSLARSNERFKDSNGRTSWTAEKGGRYSSASYSFVIREYIIVKIIT